MTKKLFVLCALSLMTALAWGQSPIIKVEGGQVQGVPSATSEVTVFRGIPYRRHLREGIIFIPNLTGNGYSSARFTECIYGCGYPDYFTRRYHHSGYRKFRSGYSRSYSEF